MKKFLKLFFIIICNLAVFAFLIFIIDMRIYKRYASSYYSDNSAVSLIYPVSKFKYMPDFSGIMTDTENFFNGQDMYSGRKPDGLEYKDKTPVIVFGCSYAYGQYLYSNQTFSYKLSHILKRPVYNRAVIAGNFAQMYLQSLSDSLYKTISDTDTVIYVMMNDHYRRSMHRYFSVLDLCVMPHYSIKNNKLIYENYKNPIENFFKSLYIVKYLNHAYVDYYINNPKNAERVTDNTLLFFTETRKELEKNYGKKLNFIVIFFEDWDIQYGSILRQKLENNGFKVISTKELTNEDLQTEKYRNFDNQHPREAAWDLLTPLLVKKLELK